MAFRKTDRISDLAAARGLFLRALAEKEAAETKFVQVGRSLMEPVAASAALARGDRRNRTSAESHVRRLLQRGGDVDLDKFQIMLDERPHLFRSTLRALHRIETEHIIGGWWRNGQPESEETLLRVAAGYMSDDVATLSSELSRAGLNSFHLAALAFRRVAKSHPELFGSLTHEQEALEIESANTLIAEAASLIQSSPALIAALCDAHEVTRYQDVDPWPSILDAAVAEHLRRQCRV